MVRQLPVSDKPGTHPTNRCAIVQGSGAAGEAAMTIDGEARAGSAIPLVDDGRDHTVELRLGGGG